MTLQQLKYVIAIAENGSITSASAKLLIAQPSLSKSVSELEKEMGIFHFLSEQQGNLFIGRRNEIPFICKASC